MGIIKGIFKLIYKIISFLNLQFTLFSVLVGLILYFTGVFDNFAIAKLIFQIVLIISLIYALLETIKKLLGLNDKVKKSKGAQIVSTEKNADKNGDDENSLNNNVQAEEDFDAEVVSNKSNVPKYFRVKQNPNLIMAEFDDRYELYEVDKGKLKKIRTDFKGY